SPSSRSPLSSWSRPELSQPGSPVWRDRNDMEQMEESEPKVVMSPQVADATAPESVQTRPEIPVFDAEHVSIYYGTFKAVTNVSLTIYQNEITAFIGPSGCGKTTVLRTLNRMNDLVPGARVEGDVRYHGVSLYGPKISPIAVRRRISMVFQKPNPFPKSIF